MNVFLENIKHEIDLVLRFGRKFNYKITEFENKYFICKMHCGDTPEAIYSGTYQECNYYLNKLYGQESLFKEF